ncbi:MAG TPA: methyltransferase domain-containing protein [Thermoanaerobaculia bacterium]|jgi:SAM-dependent methyltransferase|nr:methyltransferase domain-containing protein [Thermoanaerobaculia bacterium]
MSGDKKYLYVDETLRILTGSDAESALRTQSDAAFLDPRDGVVHVPKTRWQQAQRYERDTWMVANADTDDDRNSDHAAGFDGYAALAGRTFAHAIELGCGPFTNLRIIARRCTTQRCSLLDPLIEEYLKHPHCTYDRRALRTEQTAVSVALRRNRPGRAVRRVLNALMPGTLSRRVPIEELLPMPIEEMPARSGYDMVVMLNVLEHCYDARTIFKTIAGMLKPGGVFIFHDKLFAAKDVADDVATRFDAGHPLRVGGEMIESFLDQNFTPLFTRRGIVEDSFEEHDLSREGIYFIGERKA